MTVPRGRRHREARARVLEHATHCWLCGKPLRFDVGPRHPLAPSVDHLVAVVDGGVDVVENMLPAHYGCNSRRGRRDPSALRVDVEGAEGW